MHIVYLLLLVLAACPLRGLAEVPSVRPGGVLRLDIEAPRAAAPRVRFQQARSLVQPRPQGWRTLIGIPLETAPGWHTAEVEHGDGTTLTVPFEVTRHDYPVQHLRVKNPRHVTPDPEQLARYERERAAQDAAKRTWRDVAVDSTLLSLPVQGRRSSAFGLRRTFNGEPRQPHRGLDLAVATGTPVGSPGEGVVTLTGDYFFNGRTVFIDHGQGLISMLCHLSEIAVRTGQRVARGERIGRAGATGRATGPHVHWSVFLNGTAVDPEELTGSGN